MLIGVEPDQIREIPFKHQVLDTMIDLGALALNAIAFTLLGVVPVVGPPVAVLGMFYRTWFLLGANYFDFPLSLRGVRRADKREYCRLRRPYVLGLGAAVFIMEFVPFLSAVLLTTAVIGAVLTHRRIERQEVE